MAGIFIVGCQRSGTTALYRALAAHPNLGQQIDAGKRPKGTQKELWFFQEFFRGRDSNPHRPHWPSELDFEYQQRFARFVDEFCTTHYAKASGRWISAHPRDGLYIDQIVSLFPEKDIRVLFLIRHPQEVVWSSIRAPWAKQKLSTREMLIETTKGARYWSQFGPNTLAARDGALGNNVKLIYHRDLVEHPERTMTDVLEHIGEPFDERVVIEISKTSNSSFSDQTSRIDDLKLRSSEIANQNLFCSVVNQYTSPFMQDLGFQDYNKRANSSLLQIKLLQLLNRAGRVKNALRER